MKFDLPKIKIEKEENNRLKEIEKLEAELAAAKAAELKKIEVPKPPKEESTANNNVNIYDIIPKKTAALEIVNRLQIAFYLNLWSIVGAFLILLAGTFSKIGSYIAAMGLIIPAVIFALRFKKELDRLKTEYNLGGKK